MDNRHRRPTFRSAGYLALALSITAIAGCSAAPWQETQAVAQNTPPKDSPNPTLTAQLEPIAQTIESATQPYGGLAADLIAAVSGLAIAGISASKKRAVAAHQQAIREILPSGTATPSGVSQQTRRLVEAARN